MTKPSPQSGFSLLETLVALAILGVALTSSITLLVQFRAMDLRVTAHQQAQRCLEGQYEALRGGSALPTVNGTHDLIPICATSPPLTGIAIQANVESLFPNGYYAVTLNAQYKIGKKDFSRQMELRLWRP